MEYFHQNCFSLLLFCYKEFPFSHQIPFCQSTQVILNFLPATIGPCMPILVHDHLEILSWIHLNLKTGRILMGYLIKILFSFEGTVELYVCHIIGSLSGDPPTCHNNTNTAHSFQLTHYQTPEVIYIFTHIYRLQQTFVNILTKCGLFVTRILSFGYVLNSISFERSIKINCEIA